MKTTRLLNTVLRFASVIAAAAGFQFSNPSAQAATLTGESVMIEVRFQTLTQELVSIDQLLTSSTVTVGAGVEMASTAVSHTFMSGGFNQTISGNVTADVAGTAMTVTFAGTQQPGTIVFILKSVTDQSAASITSVTNGAGSGYLGGVNGPLTPSFSNAIVGGSISGGFVPLGFQPGVSLSQTVNFVLADAGGAPEIAVEQPTGTDIPDGGSKDMGTTDVGSSTRLTFRVRNTGTANLTGLTFNANGGANPGDFIITNNLNSPIAGPAGTDTFAVTFTPSAAGARSCTIQLVSNDADENPFDITLTGAGVAVTGPAATNLQAGAGTAGSFDWPFNSLARHPVTDEVYGFWRKDSGATALYSLIKWTGAAWSVIGTFGPANVIANFRASDYTSVAIDGTGAFHVAISGEIGTGLASTRGVFYGTSATGATGAWTFTQVETYSDPNGWKNTSHPVIKVDTNNRPHIAFDFDDVNGTRIYSSRYRWFDGAVWQGAGAAGNVHVQAGNANNEVNDVNLALDSSNKAHFVMQAETNGSGLDGSLIYINNVSGSYSAPLTLAAGATNQQQGINPNILLDAANKVHVVHGTFFGGLFHCTNASGPFVNTRINANATGVPGTECFSRNSAGDLFLVYYAGTAFIGPLHYARLPGGTGSTWTIGQMFPSPVSPADGVNFFSGILNNAGLGVALFDYSPAPGAPPRNLQSATVQFAAPPPPPAGPITFTLGATPGDASTGSLAPDATGGTDGTKFDMLRRGGWLAQNGNIVFPGFLEVGVGGVTDVPPNSNFYGIWKAVGASVTRLIRSNEAAPETGATAALFDILPEVPAINDGGQVTILASLKASGASTPATTIGNDTGLWSELGGTGFQILIREDDDIPGLPAGTKVGAFGSGCYATAMTGASTGEAAFTITMKGASTDTALLRASVLGATVTAVGVVARSGASAPGTGENFGPLNGGYTDAVRMDAAGNIAFAASLAPSVKDSLWFQPVAGGAPVKVFVAGDTAPGTSGATFSRLETPAMGGGGTIAFHGYLTPDTGDNTGNSRNSGIWRGTTGGGFTSILRRGDTVAGLASPGKVGNLWNGWLTNGNRGAWKGWVDLAGDGISPFPADGIGIYTDTSGTMTLLVKNGDASPGIAGANFFSIDHPVCGGAEQVAFIGTVTGGGTTAGTNDKGIWRTAANGGALSLVIRTGDTMATTQGSKTIANVDLPGSGDDTRRWEQPVMDATGRLIVYVTFTDGSTAQVLAP